MKGSLALLVLAGAMLLPPAALADVWEPVSGTPPTSLGGGTTAYVQPDDFRAYTLDDNPVAAAPAAARCARRPSSRCPRRTAAAALRGQRVADHGARARRPAPRDQDLRRPRHRRPGGDDPRRPDAARLPRLRPLARRRLVRRPLLPPRRQRLHHLLRARREPTTRTAASSSRSSTRTPTRSRSRPSPQGPEVQLRTYRLALLTDPGYATYFGGPQNVTAAKVTLMNRVNQVYEDETAIRLVLIADNDKLNLNTPAQMHRAERARAAPRPATSTPDLGCTGGTLNRTRIVIGQIIGASNYDIGHIALGTPGGGVASLGVVGGNSKAQGCTGLPTPVGDFFAVDYVAHEMGHQFGGPHTFNGTQRNCSGGNRSAASSVEPGSGSSIMAYAGICEQDNLQPHSDPYWSQRSFDEITAYVTSDQPADQRGPDRLAARLRRRRRLVPAPLRRQRRRPRSSRGTNYTPRASSWRIQGGDEVQTVARRRRRRSRSATSAPRRVPIVPRPEQHARSGSRTRSRAATSSRQVTLTGFNAGDAVVPGPDRRRHLGGARRRRLAVSNDNVAAAINAIPGFAGTVTSAGAGNGGFTLTFAGASAGVDVPPVEIVNCTCTCDASAQTANGGPPLATLAGRRHRGGRARLTATGFTLTLGGALQATDVAELTVSRRRRSTETRQGHAGDAPARRHGHRRRLGRRRRAERHAASRSRSAPASRARTSSSLELAPSTARAASSARPRAAARSTTRATSSRRRATTPRWSRPRRLHDPDPHAVRADRQRDRLRRRHAHLHVGAERPRRRTAGHGAGEQRQDERPAVPAVRDGRQRQRRRTR